MTSTAHQEQITRLLEMLREQKFGMLSTVDPEKGIIRSRPMLTQEVESNCTLWFMTSDVTAKVDEIEHEHQVNVNYVDPSDSTFISLSGTARMVRDPARVDRYWRDTDKAWYPRGKDDPHIVLIKVDVSDAEYWEGPSSKVVQLYAMARAIATGTRPTDVGEHAKISNL